MNDSGRVTTRVQSFGMEMVQMPFKLAIPKRRWENKCQFEGHRVQQIFVPIDT